MTIRFAILAALACLLSGCAMERDARLHYAKSVANYQDCLAVNLSNVNACEVLRLSMERANVIVQQQR